mgnify:CR=1 FL=1
MKHNFTIRKAVLADAPLILNFIRELAEYEKLLHEVEIDLPTLKKNLFGEKPYAYAIIGEYQGKPAGLALYFHNFSTFLGRPGIYLEDLYVKPDYRGKGLGKQLLSHLAKKAIEMDCGRLEWWVLNWNEPAINFYKSLGAKPMDEWTVNRVTGEALERLAESV